MFTVSGRHCIAAALSAGAGITLPIFLATIGPTTIAPVPPPIAKPTTTMAIMGSLAFIPVGAASPSADAGAAGCS
jgi:hypothetical protein